METLQKGVTQRDIAVLTSVKIGVIRHCENGPAVAFGDTSLQFRP
jgi:hypothetical protein